MIHHIEGDNNEEDVYGWSKRKKYGPTTKPDTSIFDISSLRSSNIQMNSERLFLDTLRLVTILM
jgi:hypothetical protein